jgi:hypothetical protein
MTTAAFLSHIPLLLTQLNKENQVEYYIKENNFFFNSIIGRKVTILLRGLGKCAHCKKPLKNRMYDAYCRACFYALPYLDFCMLRPEKCHLHLGTCRDSVWGKENCFSPHYLYISYTSDFKVGVTRCSVALRRWITQGAIYALPLVVAPSRKIAGMLEDYLKKFEKHTTNWRNMLRMPNNAPLMQTFDSKRSKINLHLQELLTQSEYTGVELVNYSKIQISYPYLYLLEKIKTVNLLNLKQFSDVLIGIKGQYLIFDTAVLNLSSHWGLEVDFIID